MKMNNKVQLIGHVGNTPEVLNVNNSTLAKLSLATNDYFKNNKGEKITETHWHNIIAWGKTAEIIEKYVNKGSGIAIEGKLVNRSYTDKNGVKKYNTEIVVNEILLMDKNN
jgi:single-strand DNA-binding protein